METTPPEQFTLPVATTAEVLGINDTDKPLETESQALDIEAIREASARAFSGTDAPASAPEHDAAATEDRPSQEQPTSPAQAAIPAAANPAAAALFRKVVVSSVKGTLGIADEVTRTMANAAQIDPAFTNKTLERCKPDAEALAEFEESLTMVMAKYNVQPKHAEEICLAISGARLLAPYGLLIVEFRAEIMRNRAKHFQPAKI